jgi:hypothetical protein
MDFWKTIGVLLRRWYVAVPVFFIALVIGGGVFLKVPTQYVSTGTMVLTAPTAGATTAVDPAHATGPGNPLLDFEGSLTITTQLLIQSLSSPSVGQQIAQEGAATSTYQAGDGNTGGPFVVIVATANSPQEAELTVSLALKYAQDELNARQKNLNAPPSTYIGTQSVVSPTQATTKITNKVKDGGIALVVGLILSVATAYGVDSWTSRRRRRRAADDDDDTSIDVIESDDDIEPDDGSADPTKKMRPAAPPRHVPAPQPVRAGSPRPQPATGGHRDQYGPVYGPHPAKPRPLPTPVPTNGKTNGTNGNGNGNGGNNRMDWPRTEFRSPDAPTG